MSMPDLRPLDRYPRLSRPWWRFPPVLGGLVALAISGSSYVAYEYSTYPTWGQVRTASGTPPRIDWCGRRYYPYVTGAAPQTDASLRSAKPLIRVETTPAGDPVLADPITEQERATAHIKVCAMALYVKVGPDSFVHYTLSGGP